MPVTRSQQQQINALTNALGPAMNQPTLQRSQRILCQTANTVEFAPVQQTPPPPQQQPHRRSRRLQGLPPPPPTPPSPPRARAPARSPAPSPPSPQPPSSPSPTPPHVPWPIPLHHPYLPRVHLEARIRDYWVINGIRHRSDYEITYDPMAELSNFVGNTSRHPPTRQPQPSVEQGHQLCLL